MAKLDNLLELMKAQPVRPLPRLIAATSLSPGVPVVPSTSATVTLDLAARITAERKGGSSWQAIADRLNRDAVPTARGGSHWRIRTVQSATGYAGPSTRTRLPARTERRADALVLAWLRLRRPAPSIHSITSNESLLCANA